MPSTSLTTTMRWGIATIVLLTAVLSWGAWHYSQPPKPIKIGYIGNITGPYNRCGTAGRDALVLVVDHVNASGGIHNRPIELIIRDDNANPQRAQALTHELADLDVAAIIGPTISTTAIAAAKAANERRILLISPTASTTQLAGQNDYFLRTCPPSGYRGLVPKYLYRHKGWRRIGVTYSVDNLAYTQDAYTQFQSWFEREGGQVVALPRIDKTFDVAAFTEAVLGAQIDGLYVIADTQTIIKITHAMHQRVETPVPLIIDYAARGLLLETCNRCLEGLIVCRSNQAADVLLQETPFAEHYKAQYGIAPESIHVYSYDAANMLVDTLNHNPHASPEQLKQHIIQTRQFDSPMGDYAIDHYGDAHRTPHIVQVQQGQLVRINTK